MANSCMPLTASKASGVSELGSVEPPISGTESMYSLIFLTSSLTLFVNFFFLDSVCVSMCSVDGSTVVFVNSAVFGIMINS